MKQGYLGGDVRVAPGPLDGRSAPARTYEDFTLEEGAGASPSIETVHTPATAPGLGVNPTYLHTRSPAASTRGRRPGTPGAAASTRSPTTTTPIATTPTASIGWMPRSCSTSRSCARTGSSRCTACCRRRSTMTTSVPYFLLPSLGSGSTLRGFSSWRFRDRHSLLMSAEWRWIPNRLGLDMALFYDAGKVTPTFDAISWKGLDERRRHRRSAFTGPLATPLRIELAKGREGMRLVFAGERGILTPNTYQQTTRMTRRRRPSALPPAFCRPRDRACARPAAGRQVLRRRSARRASPRRRMRRRSPEWDIDLFVRPRPEPVRAAGRSQRRTSAPATSTRSTRCPTRAGSPIASSRGRCRSSEAARGPLTGSGPAPGTLVGRPAQAGRVRAGLHDARRARATCGSCRSTPRAFPEAATGAILVANKIFWTLGYWQVENHLVSVRPEQLDIADDGQRARRRRAGSGRCARSDLEDVLAASAPQRRRQLPRRSPRRARARPAARRLPLLRHASGRSERRRAARAPARAARVEGVRRLDQPHGHEGRQHARHAGRPRTAVASSATTCRTSARRSAPARNGPHDYDEGWEYLFEGGLTWKRLLHAGFLAAAVADGRLCGASGDRAVRGRRVRSRRLEAARADGGVPARASRRQVLGGAPRDGVFRRDDSRDREDRRVQRSQAESSCWPTC